MPISVSSSIQPSGQFPVVDATHVKGGFRTLASIESPTPVEDQLPGLISTFNVSQGMLVFDTRTSKFFQLGASNAWSEVEVVGGSIASIDGLQAALNEKVNLADLPKDSNGVLDLAQESTLQDFGSSAVRVKTDNTTNIAANVINFPGLPVLSVSATAATPTSDASVLITFNTSIGITDPSASE